MKPFIRSTFSFCFCFCFSLGSRNKLANAASVAGVSFGPFLGRDLLSDPTGRVKTYAYAVELRLLAFSHLCAFLGPWKAPELQDTAPSHLLSAGASDFLPSFALVSASFSFPSC